jgi:hypothetical protein
VFGKEPTNHLVVGLGMMPRGEVGLIFLGLGTASGLLSPGLEAAILLMVIGTTFLAPVLLRLVLKDKPPEDGNQVPEEFAAGSAWWVVMTNPLGLWLFRARGGDDQETPANRNESQAGSPAWAQGPSLRSAE